MPDLKVASWNIRKCVGLDWRRDPQRTIQVLTELDADVVALQEVDKRLGQRPTALPRHLVDGETVYDVVDVDGFDESLGWHGNALLVSPKIQVEEAHAFRLPGVEPRGAILFNFTFGDAQLRLVAVHLGLLRQSRRKQFAAIRDKLASQPHRPTVILGDFNQWSEQEGMDQFPDFAVHKPGLSFHAARPVAALDRIATSPELQLLDGGVLQTPRTRLASDHLPVRGRLDWSNQTTTSNSSCNPTPKTRL